MQTHQCPHRDAGQVLSVQGPDAVPQTYWTETVVRECTQQLRGTTCGEGRRRRWPLFERQDPVGAENARKSGDLCRGTMRFRQESQPCPTIPAEGDPACLQREPSDGFATQHHPPRRMRLPWHIRQYPQAVSSGQELGIPEPLSLQLRDVESNQDPTGRRRKRAPPN